MIPAPPLRRVALNVSRLEPSIRFYVEALGFEQGPSAEVPDLARLLGVRQVRSVRLTLGAQELELCELHPGARADRPPAGAADAWFQHCAITTSDMAAAFARLCAYGPPDLISSGGPVVLPQASGGATAVKFRDSDGHPLELIALPDGSGPGINHSALVCTNGAESRRFYAELGMALAHSQENRGPEQDHLDGLKEAKVEVLSLHQEGGALGVELLAYEHPRPAPAPPLAPDEVLASRLVFGPPEAAGAAQPAGELLRDPDGHILLLGR